NRRRRVRRVRAGAQGGGGGGRRRAARLRIFRRLAQRVASVVCGARPRALEVGRDQLRRRLWAHERERRAGGQVGRRLSVLSQDGFGVARVAWVIGRQVEQIDRARRGEAAAGIAG